MSLNKPYNMVYSHIALFFSVIRWDLSPGRRWWPHRDFLLPRGERDTLHDPGITSPPIVRVGPVDTDPPGDAHYEWEWRLSAVYGRGDRRVWRDRVGRHLQSWWRVLYYWWPWARHRGELGCFTGSPLLWENRVNDQNSAYLRYLLESFPFFFFFLETSICLTNQFCIWNRHWNWHRENLLLDRERQWKRGISK